jgi:hypothetical protein
MQAGVATPLDLGVSSITASEGGFLYELKATGGNLVRRLGAATTTLDVGVQAYGVSANGALFDLEGTPGTPGQLWTYTSAGWKFVDSDVVSFVLPQGTGIVELEKGGQVWLNTSRGWTLLARNASTLAPGAAPYQGWHQFFPLCIGGAQA